MGLAALVRAMEVLGRAQVDMRDAPDPRVSLEVALVRLAHPEADDSPEALLSRIERLEAADRTAGATPAAPPAPAAPPRRASGAPTSGPPAGPEDLPADGPPPARSEVPGATVGNPVGGPEGAGGVPPRDSGTPR